jgi:holo-[acyl-carrier protein] synthase
MLRKGPVKQQLAVGIDMVEVERIQRAHLRRGGPFLQKIFCKNEIEYCMRQRFPWQSLAARFAAKEAVAKALGTGMGHGVSFRSIAVANGAGGKPFVQLFEKSEEIFRIQGWTNIALSLSHTSTAAIAYVVLSH